MSLLADAQNHIHHQRYAQAADAAERLLRLGMNKTEAYNLLGQAHMYLGHKAQAAHAFRQLAALQPNNISALQNVMLFHVREKQWDSALAYCQRMAAIEPRAHTFYNMALSQMHTGRLAECAATLQQALQQFPDDAPLTALATEQRLITSPLTAWEEILQIADIHAAQGGPRIALLQDRVVAAWVGRLPTEEIKARLTALADELNRHTALVQGIDNGTIIPDFNQSQLLQGIKNGTAYLGMFGRLLATPAPARNTRLPRMWMLGDSHCLPPHGQTVTWRGQTYQLESQLVTGLKAWHLAQTEDTKYRANFLHQLAHLPEGEPCLVSAGEIDCRTNEGIWPRVQKGEDAATLTANTFPPMVERLHTAAADRPLIIAGTPSPHLSRTGNLPLHQQFAYPEMVAAANKALQRAAHTHGMDFLDIFTLTAQHPNLYLENIHLTPATIPGAFANHLQTAPTA